LASSLQVEKTIIKGILGIMKKDKGLILEAATEHAIDININPEIFKKIADIVMDDYDPKLKSLNKSKGKVLGDIKALLRIIFQDLSDHNIKSIFELVIELNPEFLVELNKEISMPEELFDMAVGILNNNEDKLAFGAENLLEKVIPKDYKKLFFGLFFINQRKVMKGVSNLAEIQ
jgi:hypothetical protein